MISINHGFFCSSLRKIKGNIMIILQEKYTKIK